VYWAEASGAVITSANLSTNAFGAGGLKEFGIRLSDSELDIDKLLRLVKPRKVTQSELRKLAIEHRRYWARNPPGKKKHEPGFFDTWLWDGAADPWKVGIWFEKTEWTETALAAAKSEYGREPEGGGIGGKKNSYVEGDWILEVCRSGNKLSRYEWMYVDRVVSLNKQEAVISGWPFQAISVYSTSDKRRTAVPFRIDSAFRKAFEVAACEYGFEKLRHLSRLPTKFFKTLQRSTNALRALELQ
jgi:hypothetical protein